MAPHLATMTPALTAGLSLKPQHYDAALACPEQGMGMIKYLM